MKYHFGYFTIQHIHLQQGPGGAAMIYERIKQLREKQGYTQTELAKILGVTRSCVNAWEMGISVPSTQSLVQLSQIFDISTDYLLGLSNGSSIRTDGLSDADIQLVHSLVQRLKNGDVSKQ